MSTKLNFKEYLFLESKQFLSHKIGNILAGVHELLAGGKQVGARQLVKHAENIVNHIRKVLHSSWSKSDQKYLKTLQKCGVALMKTIDEKGDLQQTLNGVRSEIEKLSGKLGEPVNKLAEPAKEQETNPGQEEDLQQPTPAQPPPNQPVQPSPMPAD